MNAFNEQSVALISNEVKTIAQTLGHAWTGIVSFVKSVTDYGFPHLGFGI